MAAVESSTTMEAAESSFLTKLPRELRDVIYELYAPDRRFHVPLRIQAVPVPAGTPKNVTIGEPLECVIGSTLDRDMWPSSEQAGSLRIGNGHALAFANKQTYREYAEMQSRLNRDLHHLYIAAPVRGLVKHVPELTNALKGQEAPVSWDAKRLSISLDFTKCFSAKALALFRRSNGESVTIGQDRLTVFKHAGEKYKPGDKQART